MLDFLELEETVGRFWHKLVGDTASLAHHPQAAVTLASMAPTLAVCFRGFGGEPGIKIVPARERALGHRLNLRQRVGLGEERLAQALRTPDSLQLPAQIAIFPEAGLNRDLYVWLAALTGASAEWLVYELRFTPEAGSVTFSFFGMSSNIGKRTMPSTST